MNQKLLVCINRRHPPNPHSCGNSGGQELAAKLEESIRESGLEVVVERIACLSMCANGPNIQLQPDGRNWHRVGEKETEEILSYLKNK